VIKNENQYRLARAQVAKAQQSLRQLWSRPQGGPGAVHPTVRKAQEAGLTRQVDDLTAQIAAYEAAHLPTAAEAPTTETATETSDETADEDEAPAARPPSE
jgi:hypothetical protein